MTRPRTPGARLADLAVVVVNYGPPDLLRDGIAPVAAALAPARLVVVDNFSTAASRTAVRRLCDARGWTGVFPSTNTGFGTGCNLGAEAALELGARHLLFLNPDATIDRRSVELLLARLAQDERLVVAPRILTSSGAVWSAGTDLDLETGEMRSWRHRAEVSPSARMPWVSGACLLIDAGLWREVGGFDDGYFLYWEDVDLCARVRAAGGRVDVVEEATAVHDAGQTHTERGARAKSSTYYYFNIRNRALFAATWLDRDRQRLWRRTSVRAAYHVLLRGGRRQFGRPAGPVSAAWRGLRDGRRQARRRRRAAALLG